MERTQISEFEKSLELGYKKLGLEYTPERDLDREHFEARELLKLGRALQESVLAEATAPIGAERRLPC